ncbi:hypothetical protein HDU98_005323 [Podochytrium sp. JEL0797]|nr:hypothetical protein HDU98_005323 [Podochytrium sp. JEL0797]
MGNQPPIQPFRPIPDVIPIKETFTEAEQITLSQCRLPQGATRLSNDQLRTRIAGLLVGTALGDAFGLSTEFLNKKQIAHVYPSSKIRFGKQSNDEDDDDEAQSHPFLQDRHRSKFKEGSWTDDTDQALLILDTILVSYASRPGTKTVDPKLFASRLYAWSFHGIQELSKPAYGIGLTVGSVLSHPRFLENPAQAATDIQHHYANNMASNGAIMRTAVCAVPFFWDEAVVEGNADRVCTVTHADDRCIASCRIVCRLIAIFLAGCDFVVGRTRFLMETILAVTARCRTHLRDPAALDRYISMAIDPTSTLADFELDEGSSIGFTYKCLGSGVFCLMRMSMVLDDGGIGLDGSSRVAVGREFRRILLELILEGGDADTNGAVAGALMGAFVGEKNLPKEWVEGLRDVGWLKERSELLANMLLQ